MEAESSNTKKIIAGVVTVVLVVFGIYFFFFRSPDIETMVLDEFGNPVQAQVVGQDLIDLLAELQSVTLDAAIFSSPLFRNLNDFSITLPEVPRGRTDPFSPL